LRVARSKQNRRTLVAILQGLFPEGKEDPDIAVMRVDVDSVEYWETASSKMVQVVGLVKSLVTGEAYRPGKNETVDMKTGVVEDTKEKTAPAKARKKATGHS